MKVKFHSIVLYILLVILPTIGIGATFYSYHSYKMKQENKRVAHTVLFLYRDYLDRHLGEAISALEMLSKVVGTETGNINGMKEIVHDTDGNDARFSGLYYATPEGIITIASEGDRPPVDVSDRKYIQNALQTKKTTVSSVITDRVLGHQAIMIASPIFNKQKELSGLLLASLRFDYISSSLNAIKPQYHFEVTDKYDVVFLNDDNNETSDAHSNMLTTPKIRLEGFCFSVTYSPKTLNQWVAVECIATLFLMSILFLLAQYMLLKRQTKLERQQNELQKLN